MANIEQIWMRENGHCEFTIKVEGTLSETTENRIFEHSCINIYHEGVKWSLKVFPKGRSENTKDFLIVRILRMESQGFNNCGTWTICLLDQYDAPRCEDQRVLCNSKKRWQIGWPKSIITDPRYDLITRPGNTLTVFCKIERQHPKFDLAASENKTSFSLRSGSRKRIFTDFTIRVQGKLIKAHKVFLAESSEFFLELFTEQENKRILDLKDVDFETADKMIDFVYKGKVEDMQRFAKPLLVAANEYKFKRLSKYCQKYLYENLSSENVIKTLKFAIANKSVELEEECLQFMAKNIREIPKLNWEDIISKNPLAFRKLFRDCVYQNHKKILEFYKQATVVSQVNGGRQPSGLLAQDFEYLFLNPLLSDVDIEVDGHILKAHKSVLFSRSTVFRAMFSHDTKEAKKNKVHIEDLSFEIVREMLRYMYCEKVENLDAMALDLLKAADKYNLPSLVDVCAKSLEKNLNIENVAETLGITDIYSHNCATLKERSLALIGRNILEVIETKGWKTLMKKNAKCINGIFIDWIKRFF